MEDFVDVSDAFDGWTQKLLGKRNSGTYIEGRWVEELHPIISFEGVVQNATPEDLMVLDEGNRTEESIKIHTTFELVAQNGDTTTGDTITYNSSNWLVFSVARRAIGNYYKVIAVKQ